MEPMKYSMPHFRHRIKHCLSQISRHKVLRIKKKKCSSRYSPGEFELKLNHFSQNHDAHYCSLFEKITISQMFCFLSPQKNSPIHYLKNKTKNVLLYFMNKHKCTTQAVRGTTRKMKSPLVSTGH